MFAYLIDFGDLVHLNIIAASSASAIDLDTSHPLSEFNSECTSRSIPQEICGVYAEQLWRNNKTLRNEHPY